MTLADNDIRKVTGTAELAGVRVRYPLLDRPFSGVLWPHSFESEAGDGLRSATLLSSQWRVPDE